MDVLCVCRYRECRGTGKYMKDLYLTIIGTRILKIMNIFLNCKEN